VPLLRGWPLRDGKVQLGMALAPELQRRERLLNHYCTFESEVSGYTAQNVAEDQLSHVAEFQPTIITLEVGANDVAQGVSIDTYRANVRVILDSAKASGARVVVMPQNEWFRSPEGQSYGTDLAERRAAFDAVIIEEAKARAAEFVDLRPMFKEHADKEMWIDDGIHPTPAAYEAWASELARVLPSPCGK